MSKDFSKVLKEGLENLSEEQLQEVATDIDAESFYGLDEEIQEALKLIMSEEKIEEVTAAADTLKPKGAPGQSKAEMLSTFTSLMSQLGKEDLSKWYNDAIAQSKKSADGVDSSAATKNKNSVEMKKSAAIKESVDEIFSEDENLSEDFKEKATTIFEAVVNTEITQEKVRLSEEFEAKEAELNEQFEVALQEEANEIFEDVTEKLNSYLDFVVENWMVENEVAIESSIRTDLAENFIQGLQNLFTESYVTVPDEKVDIISEMKEQIDSLTAQLNETTDEKLELQTFVDSANKEAILDEASEGLAETQVEKLRSLSEGIEFSDEETYAKKLAILKESFFKSSNKSATTGMITEEIDGTEEVTDEVTNAIIDEDVAKYAQAISKTKK